MNINDIEKQFTEDPLVLPDEKNFVVIVGGNNSGKSTFLRALSKTHIDISNRVDVNRTVLKGEGAQDKNYLLNLPAYKSSSLGYESDNNDRPIQTLQDFFNLEDDLRSPIIEWYNKFFPNYLYEERENPKNNASPMFLKVGGHPITDQGSGMRSTLEIFIKLHDPSIKILCIDEPELGLEPYLQKYLFEAIKEKSSNDKKIIIATHSHHFLDYDDVTNNYICARNSEGKISITQADDLRSIIFRLLGNTLSSMLLPENILILEGSSDTTYLKKCLELLGKPNYAIHNSRSNSNISYGIHAITQFLKFNEGNMEVYRGHIYVIADLAKDTIVREWKGLLPNPNKQLMVLSKNGIEYYYPEIILQNIFQTEENRDSIIDSYLGSNPNEFNGIRLSKNQLAARVSELLTPDHMEEANNELFGYLKANL